jgi:hypothetical protein
MFFCCYLIGTNTYAQFDEVKERQENTAVANFREKKKDLYINCC